MRESFSKSLPDPSENVRDGARLDLPGPELRESLLGHGRPFLVNAGLGRIETSKDGISDPRPLLCRQRIHFFNEVFCFHEFAPAWSNSFQQIHYINPEDEN